jgi:hypothetical protein
VWREALIAQQLTAPPGRQASCSIPRRPRTRKEHTSEKTGSSVCTYSLFDNDDSATAQAQESATPVGVYHEGKDMIGQRLAYAVRERIRRSAGHSLQSSGSRYEILMVSIDVDPNVRNVASAVSVTYVWTGPSGPSLYMSATVITVGRQRIDEMAESIVADLDSLSQ